MTMHQAGRVKSHTVLNILQLLSLVEILKGSLQGLKTLLIMEGLSPLLLAQKVIICLMITVVS